jgi:hypothetical protein
MRILLFAIAWLLLMTVAACDILSSVTTGPTAATNTTLSKPAGQLFCALDKAGGQVIVSLIDAEATAAAGVAAPVAILATGATATAVQNDCTAAAASTGATAGVPVSPPSNVATVANVAIVKPAS